VALPSNRSFTDSLRTADRAAFYEHHKSIAVVMILIVFLLPLAGVYVTGLFGAIFGVIISILCYYLTPYVWLTLEGGRKP
jgi:hypothetical protein